MWAFCIPQMPRIRRMPTCCPEVCKYYLHLAIWIPRDSTRTEDFGPVGHQRFSDMQPYPAARAGSLMTLLVRGQAPLICGLYEP